MYDQRAVGSTLSDTDREVYRRRSFLWYHFNLYETVWADFHTHHARKLTKTDQAYWRSWDRYVQTFLSGSAEAREMVTDPQAMSLLNEEFVLYLRHTLSAVVGSGKLGLTAIKPLGGV